MSLLDSFFAAAHHHANELAGNEIQCKRPADVEYESITAIVTPEKRERRRSDTGLEIVTMREVTVEEACLPGEVARIDLTWRYEDQTYSTDEITDALGGFKCITLKRVESRRPQRKNYSG